MSNDKVGLWLAAALVALTIIVIGTFVAFGGFQGGMDRYPGPMPPNRPMPVEPDGGPGGVVCTMDARQCPDGSFVGRTGPNCEFAPCPGARGQLEINY